MRFLEHTLPLGDLGFSPEEPIDRMPVTVPAGELCTWRNDMNYDTALILLRVIDVATEGNFEQFARRITQDHNYTPKEV